MTDRKRIRQLMEPDYWPDKSCEQFLAKAGLDLDEAAAEYPEVLPFIDRIVEFLEYADRKENTDD